MKKSILVAAVITAGLALSASAEQQETMSETVSLHSLPTNVRQAIKEKVAEGEIVGVKREDDASGKWNYEVKVESNGKDWGFEVSPNGQVLKKW